MILLAIISPNLECLPALVITLFESKLEAIIRPSVPVPVANY